MNRAQAARLAAQARWPGAAVIGRGRSAIYHAHPTLRRVMIDAVVGAMHTLAGAEIDTAWRASAAPWDFENTEGDYRTRVKAQFNAADVVEWAVSGETIRFIAGQLDYHNDRNDVQLISAPQAVAGQVTDEVIAWQGAYGPGLDFQWRNRETRLVKLLTVQSLASLTPPSAQILGGTNPVLRLQFQFTVSGNVDIWINGARWGQTSSRDTTGVVEFRSASSGEVLWTFAPGKAWDTWSEVRDPAQITPVMRLRKTGPSLFVEVRVPWGYLQAAAYPVYVDPTIDVSPAQSNHDAYQAAGTVNISIVNPNVDEAGEYAGFYFPGITITNYASMVASYLALYFSNVNADEPDLTVWGEDNATPAVFSTSANDISNRTATTATVAWSSADLGAPGSFNSPSLNTIINELATSYSYSSGAIVIIFTSANGTATRDALHVHQDDATNPDPALHIEYNQAGGSLPPARRPRTYLRM